MEGFQINTFFGFKELDLKNMMTGNYRFTNL
mgnify:CR=1 FL=1